MPSLVHKVGVAAHREHLHSVGLQLVVLLCEVYQFRGTHECEIGRIEEEQGPLAFDVFVGNGLELSVLESVYFKLGYLCVDD